jgi:protein TonB
MQTPSQTTKPVGQVPAGGSNVAVPSDPDEPTAPPVAPPTDPLPPPGPVVLETPLPVPTPPVEPPAVDPAPSPLLGVVPPPPAPEAPTD